MLIPGLYLLSALGIHSLATFIKVQLLVICSISAEKTKQKQIKTKSEQKKKTTTAKPGTFHPAIVQYLNNLFSLKVFVYCYLILNSITAILSIYCSDTKVEQT